MDVALRGLVYFIVSLIIMIIFIFIARKVEERKEKEEKKTEELDNLRTEKKIIAKISMYNFRKKVHLINPITFSNGVTVSFVEKEDSVLNYTSFEMQYKINGKTYYDALYYDSKSLYDPDFPHVLVNYKYSLEELKGYDWIIETAYNLTENRINKIKEEKNKKELFVKTINNNELVAKIKQ